MLHGFKSLRIGEKNSIDRTLHYFCKPSLFRLCPWRIPNMLALGNDGSQLSSTLSNGRIMFLDFSNVCKKCQWWVMFICNHCRRNSCHWRNRSNSPWISEKGVAFIGINSNDIESYPQILRKRLNLCTTNSHFLICSMRHKKLLKHTCSLWVSPDIYVFLMVTTNWCIEADWFISSGNDIPVDGKGFTF